VGKNGKTSAENLKAIVIQISRVHIIWRFYSDPTHAWRWQRIPRTARCLGDRSGSYKNYEGCLADAETGLRIPGAQP